MTEKIDPTSRFYCFDCGHAFVLPEHGEASAPVVCAACDEVMGTFERFDMHRMERRYVIMAGKPDTYSP